jgi:hypothetical protein
MKATIRTFLSTILGILALMASAHFAHAFHNEEILPAWTQTASSCAVDESALSKFQFNLADFSYKGTETSDVLNTSLGPITQPIVARCNVVNPLDSGNPSWNALIVGYQDPDGTGTAHSVRVRLYRVSRHNGTAYQVAVFSSNSSSATGRTEGLTEFSHTFDFLNNEYFVQMELIRQNTNQNPVIYHVRLTRHYVLY